MPVEKTERRVDALRKNKAIWQKRWREKNKDKIAEYQKRYMEIRKSNSKGIPYSAKYSKENPWVVKYHLIKQRCTNKKDDSYHNYGGRGIKCLMTAKDLKEIWLRDKAYLLKRPSIDRIDNDGHYVYDNCRFIELIENTTRPQLERTHCKNGHEYTKANTKINPKGHRNCCACRTEYEKYKRIR